MLKLLKLTPYAAIAVLLIAMLWVRADKIKAENKAVIVAGQLKTANEVNAANERAFERLDEQAKANEKLRSDLVAAVAEIDSRTAATSTAIGQLRKDNAATRAYLDTRIPDDLRGLLNGTQARPASVPIGSSRP